MTELATAFFHLEGDIYIGQDPARGPWSEYHCHGGPVTGAIARSIELLAGEAKPLVRLTVDLMRPVPLAGFRVEAKLLGETRRLATVSAELTDLNGKVCATARSMHIAEVPVGEVATAPAEPLVRAEATPGRFPIQKARHDKPKFGHCVEVAYPPGEDESPGPTTMWMKTPPLIEGEVPSPFQLLCPLADCGNALSRNGELSEMGFVNPDLTIVMHRPPKSQWLASQSWSDWNESGIGLASAIIHDEEGPCATALQTLVLQRA